MYHVTNIVSCFYSTILGLKNLLKEVSAAQTKGYPLIGAIYPHKKSRLKKSAFYLIMFGPY